MQNLQYYAFNKPYGILSQFSGDDIHITLTKFAQNYNLPKDVYPVGRLDKDSEGLLILSNDKEFIDQLIGNKSVKEKTYWAQVENIPKIEAIEKLKNGLLIEDYKTKKCSAKIINPINITERDPPIRKRQSIPTAWLEIVLTEGKNRQVRKMTAKIGHPTLRLIRVKIGKLSIGDLPPGEFRKIKKEDIL
jgi:23S rRNA pseudouridine2457 synthase